VTSSEREEQTMTARYRQIEVEHRDDVFCVRLRKSRLSETDILETTSELIALATQEGCRKLALSLGPESPACMYSLFLAKLITVQRRLCEEGGAMILCEVSPAIKGVFEVTRLDDQFTFVPDFDAAVAIWKS
jgi:hypothetical protein